MEEVNDPILTQGGFGDLIKIWLEGDKAYTGYLYAKEPGQIGYHNCKGNPFSYEFTLVDAFPPFLDTKNIRFVNWTKQEFLDSNQNIRDKVRKITGGIRKRNYRRSSEIDQGLLQSGKLKTNLGSFVKDIEFGDLVRLKLQGDKEFTGYFYNKIEHRTKDSDKLTDYTINFVDIFPPELENGTPRMRSIKNGGLWFDESPEKILKQITAYEIVEKFKKT